MQPPATVCWKCGKRFQGNHKILVIAHGLPRFIHTACVDPFSPSAYAEAKPEYLGGRWAGWDTPKGV